MSTGKKVAVALTRAFVGQLGVDCFIMGRIGSGIWAIITTIILSILPYPLMLLNIIPGIGTIIFGICEAILAICIFVRLLAFFISGLLLLGKTPEEVEARY